MNEVIENVLNDETITTNEERLEAIKKGLATIVIPKEKYNDLSNRLKSTESSYESLKTEFDDFKKLKMTDDEKQVEEKKQFENDKKANALLKSELEVQKLLLKNGIEIKDDDTELQETLQNIVSEDLDRSIKLTNNFITLLNKTKENAEKATTTNLLNNTPKPIGGVNSSSSVSRIDELNNQLQEAIKNKDTLLQTHLMSEIFNEQQKPNI